MQKDIEINFDYNFSLDGKYIVEMEIINHKDNTAYRKVYKANTRKKVIAIAKAQETRILNKFYGGK